MSLYLLQLEAIGAQFSGPHTAGIALRVPDVRSARASSRAEASCSTGRHLRHGVCHMAFFSDPDGNALMLHRRYAREPDRPARALPRAAAADEDGRAVALHRPGRVRSGRLVGERRRRRSRRRATCWTRGVRCRRRRRGGDPDRARTRRHPLRAAGRGSPAALLARRLGREVRRAQRRHVASTGCSSRCRRASCSTGRCTSGSRTRSRAARCSGGCSSSPSRRAASR